MTAAISTSSRFLDLRVGSGTLPRSFRTPLTGCLFAIGRFVDTYLLFRRRIRHPQLAHCLLLHLLEIVVHLDLKLQLVYLGFHRRDLLSQRLVLRSDSAYGGVSGHQNGQRAKRDDHHDKGGYKSRMGLCLRRRHSLLGRPGNGLCAWPGNRPRRRFGHRFYARARSCLPHNIAINICDIAPHLDRPPVHSPGLRPFFCPADGCLHHPTPEKFTLLVAALQTRAVWRFLSGCSVLFLRPTAIPAFW